jgi:hypothetical protein
MIFDNYTGGDTTVTVNRKLSQEEFKKIELLLKQRLGRHKEGSEKYVFTCELGHILNTLLAYLRNIKAPHQFETLYIWDGRK